ncbi:MAG TPA: DUF2334 domain-containing protein [Solirubrobacteraceae bacterium]|nr:DUF2334 domain-containing protein [Solirubrobacteraceae bacterium]
MRTARLICLDALPTGEVDAAAIRFRRPRLRGELAHIALKSGWYGWSSLVVTPAFAVRRRLLGDRAPGPPRVLIRVDEFPHAHARDEPQRFGTEAFARFHEVLAAAGVPYLVAVLPRVARDYLNIGGDDGDELSDGEVAMLARLRDDGVAFALHAHTHRTRDPRPRHRSALRGLTAPELERCLDAAEARLRRCGVRSRVFVPPFNQFDADQFAVLARRYPVVCGGPETVRTMGLQPSPRWIGDGVYLPSYEPLYGRAADALGAVRALAAENAAVWAAVTLHVGWELDDGLHSLSTFAREVAPYARPWQEFLAAVDASR